MYECLICGKWHSYGFTCSKEKVKASAGSLSGLGFPIINLEALKPAKIRSRCSKCGERYDSEDGHYCSTPIVIEPVKPLIGPGTMSPCEFYRTQHAPLHGTDARKLFDYCCPPQVVFGFGNEIKRVN